MMRLYKINATLLSIAILALAVVSIGVGSKVFINLAATHYVALGGCLIIIICAILFSRNKGIFFSKSDVAIVIFIIYILLRSMFSGQFGYYHGIALLSFFTLYIIIRNSALNHLTLNIGLSFIGITQATYGIGQYFGVFKLNTPYYEILGSFSNPAGLAVCLLAFLPFSLVLIEEKIIKYKLIGIISSLTMLVAILFAGSRAAYVGTCIILAFWGTRYLRYSLHQKLFSLKWMWAIILFTFVLIGALYFLKPDSANGRVLIWKCSLNMFLDSPLWGNGAGAFKKSYMLYQADYLNNNPGSIYSSLADSVETPFNEYLRILVEYGLVGLVLLCVCLHKLIHVRIDSENIPSFLCILGIGIMAFFSYPLSFPIIKVMLIISIGILLKNEPPSGSVNFNRTLAPACIILYLICLICIGKLYRDEYKWSALSKRGYILLTPNMLFEYENLYSRMNKNPLFLYNYGNILNSAGKFEYSNKILLECEKYFNNPNIQCLIADNHTELGDYQSAEKRLLTASCMVPCRFVPLYKLHRLYIQTDQHRKAIEIACRIISKPVKINSSLVQNIKREMNDYLSQQ